MSGASSAEEDNPVSNTLILRKASLTEEQWDKYLSVAFNLGAKEAYFGANSKPKGGRADSAVMHKGANKNTWAQRFSFDIEDAGETARR